MARLFDCAGVNIFGVSIRNIVQGRTQVTVAVRFVSCRFRKLHPGVAMVQSAKELHGNDNATALYWSTVG
jgi:hypothetical protein